jgi:deoxyadenosine/deoxycytidine kinase
MFAEANLNDSEELRLFRELYEYLIHKIPVPDKIICLSADTELIYKRVLERNRESEKNITRDYINKINGHYEKLYSKFESDRIPIIRIDMNENDFVSDPQLAFGLAEKL